MNNGVNTNNTGANPQQPVLQPMPGVTIAPASSAPVNASATSSAVQTQTQSNNPAVPVQSQPVSQATQPIPVVNQTTAVSQQPVQSPTLPSNSADVSSSADTTLVGKGKKKRKSIVPLFLLIILLMGGYIYYITKSYRAEINQINYNCTPITSSKDEVKLDVNSTLVRDLYLKVSTSIREDIAEPYFNDSMRLYLAYRQILETQKYETDCKYFSPYGMEPFSCEVSAKFVPKGFREDTLVREIKKLYGESTEIPLANIQLGTSCIGGYQYIPAQHEFVQGICSQENATSFTVDKKVVEAVSNRNTIIIKEEVKYHENEKMSLPAYLKNGYYYYTFRLDLNYNYVLVSKTYESKY